MLVVDVEIEGRILGLNLVEDSKKVVAENVLRKVVLFVPNLPFDRPFCERFLLIQIQSALHLYLAESIRGRKEHKIWQFKVRLHYILNQNSESIRGEKINKKGGALECVLGEGFVSYSDTIRDGL